MVEAPAHLGPDLGGAGRRRHALGAAHEQIVFEHIAQSTERVADSRLGDAQPVPGTGGAALLHHGVEHAEQVEVERGEVHRQSGSP